MCTQCVGTKYIKYNMHFGGVRSLVIKYSHNCISLYNYILFSPNGFYGPASLVIVILWFAQFKSHRSFLIFFFLLSHISFSKFNVDLNFKSEPTQYFSTDRMTVG